MDEEDLFVKKESEQEKLLNQSEILIRMWVKKLTMLDVQDVVNFLKGIL